MTMRTVDQVQSHLRASWRYLLVSLLRLTHRVQDGLENQMRRLG